MRHLVMSILVALPLAAFAVPQPAVRVDASSGAQGLVYAYGILVPPPHVFSGVEEDTLRLNGLPYFPRRGPATPPIVVDAATEAMHAANVAAFDRAKRGGTYQERLTLLAAEYRARADVASVRVQGNGLWLTYRDGTEEEVILPAEESPPPMDLATCHQLLVEEFRAYLNAGCLVVFGTGYHVTVPPKWIPKTLEAIELARSTGHLSREAAKNTALQNPLFFADLLAHR